MVEAGQLWICGECQGEQTWGSAGNMKLVDDITYHYTDRGEAPDGSDGGAINRMDYLAWSPSRRLTCSTACSIPGLHPPSHNCDGDAEGIWIYAPWPPLPTARATRTRTAFFQFEYQHRIFHGEYMVSG
jgi:hypothetical protein